ncbi:hypothetical protein Nepgr_032424 [Nepenthes gracilis]|uniref:Uncharacterized protein n=1 Tax=Nepenthes gracilis TaxID=150966 RepID=A0AAD3TK03_NEPGR|nr:hypothetical protein Nepgr_032424 [Nepenthes gracilis]
MKFWIRRYAKFPKKCSRLAGKPQLLSLLIFNHGRTSFSKSRRYQACVRKAKNEKEVGNPIFGSFSKVTSSSDNLIQQMALTIEKLTKSLEEEGFQMATIVNRLEDRNLVLKASRKIQDHLERDAKEDESFNGTTKG